MVAGALNDGDGRWLMHRRPFHKHHGGLWEFPGGKVENGENPPFALIRELEEELGISIEADDLVPSRFAHECSQVAENPIVILLYRIAVWAGIPAALEGGEIGWFTPQEIAALDKPPLDIALADRLFEKEAR
ncbi:(deoxy)nucleoside triphosphate pyrophosphohydrolase [Altererythrobacter arenosus]|uniref:(deoxy)nucleoside triphosphate pyrophosphohydrolase n=1 Tax=Altererythrobacter arenosus TaxID=3032592 RepID=UPI003242C90C